MSFTLDTSQFSRAVGYVVSVTNKDIATVLNRAALVAIIGGKGVQGALQRTPKANPVRIQNDLTSFGQKLAIKIVMSRARKKGEKLKRREIGKRVRALINSRKRAAGYTRGPGWNNAIKDLGGRGVRTTKRFQQSEAVYGRASRATPERLITKIINTAPAAEKIGFQALQDALNDTAADMIEYGEGKLQQRFKEVSP